MVFDLMSRREVRYHHRRLPEYVLHPHFVIDYKFDQLPTPLHTQMGQSRR
jgi:hypothetical protein